MITEKVTVRNPEGEEVREEKQQGEEMAKKGLASASKKTRAKVVKRADKPKEIKDKPFTVLFSFLLITVGSVILPFRRYDYGILVCYAHY